MALKDYYDEADVLDSLSWCGMENDVRVRRLARKYIEDERSIRCNARGYYGPTKGTVSTYIKSIYVPPRGTLASTVRQVLKEITRQKEIKEKRSKNPPLPPFKQPTERESIRNRQTRRNALSKSRFKIIRSDRSYHGGVTTSEMSHNCVGITTIGGCLMIVDGGSYYHKSRVYLKDKETGRESVYVLKGERIKSVTGALRRLAPKGVLRGLFDGKLCELQFDGGFKIDGEFVPFRNVAHVYHGDEIQATSAKENGW